MKNITLLMAALFSAILPCHSQVYESHPLLALTLGHGVNMSDLSDGKIFSPFKQPLQTQFENTTGTASTEFYESIITSIQDLYQAYNLDLSVQARYLTFNASASYNISQTQLLDQTSLTVRLGAETNFGNEDLQVSEDNLTPDAKALLSSGKYAGFVNKYGNYIVNKVEHASRINVFLTLQNIDQQTKQSISASAEGGGSYGAFSGSAKGSINSAINQSARTQNIIVNLQANGDTSGFKGLRDFIGIALMQQDPITAIVNNLKAYLSQFSRASSPVTKYYLSSVTSLGVPKANVQWNPTTDDLLLQAQNKYFQLAKNRTQCEILLNSKTVRSFISADDLQTLNVEHTALDAAITNLLYLEGKCLGKCQSPSVNLSTCCVPDNIPSPKTPVIDKYSSILQKLDHTNLQYNYIDQGQQYVLLDVKNINITGKKASVFVRFYFASTIATRTAEEGLWIALINEPMDFELLINGKPVAMRPRPEKLNVPPFPLQDPATGAVQGFTNYFIYNVENIPIDSDNLNIALKFVSYNNPQFPYNQVKIYPGLTLQTEIGD